MPTYDHWLVTQFPCEGRLPPGEKLRPIALVPIARGRKALDRAVRARIEKLSTIFLDKGHSSMDALKAASRPLITSIMSNLWVRDVRLVASTEDIGADEVGVEWVLFNETIPLPAWQGAADGVIPRDTPVTVAPEDSAASKYEVIEV